MNWQECIVQRPDIMMGNPVLKGTRLTVELILERLADGNTVGDALDAHPRLRPEHIRPALAYAAAAFNADEIPDSAEEGDHVDCRRKG